MADGSGKKDVSDEIEDEEQVLGLQDDEQNEQQKDNEEQKADDGLEMTTDLKGS